MDKWNDICCVIEKYTGNNLKEDTFQNVVENIFGLLGWSHHKNEIDTKRRLRYGSSRTMVPDIIIQSEGKDRFVVELKKQSIAHLEDHVLQLVSYMTRIRVSFGLLIGANIQFYYDVPNDKKDPIKLTEIDFTKDNLEGSKLIELLKRESFDEEKLIEYCNEKLEEANDRNIATDLINKISSNDGVEKLLKLLIAELKNDYNDNIIKNVVENISIKINPKIENVNIKSITTKSFNTNIESRSATSGKLPIELIPNDVDEFKRKFIEIGSAILCFHYENGRIEEKIWKKVNFSESADLKANLRSRPEARKGKWKELGIAKLVCKINYPTIN
jgi:hypothetical protein